ncbi:MAG TPA: trypsin-like peptidase domain-containing protein [Gaiellaceae bacterium]|nr:trypsin-like peptidase domain-containing protein [Gaiellaceae bacterium]
MGRTRILSFRAIELLFVAVVGGALALGGAALLGKLGSHTTIQQVSPLGGGGVGNVTLQAPATGALTAEQIYKRDAPGVVQVTATDPASGSQSLGSGFVIDKAGHIVTNYHVVQGAKSVQVSFSNGENVKASVVGTDPSTDIAVLEVHTHSRALTPLAWGDSDALKVGDSVVAIGNPFGYSRSVTAGIVSAVDRPLTAPNNFTIGHAIQTDAALNHGNSGGPLLDARGDVIGVNSQISTGNTGQQGNLGIGFAIPSNAVRNVVAQLIQNGHVEHAYLGLRLQELSPSIAQLFRLPVEHGLLVGQIEPGSGAAKAGLRGPTNQATVAGVSWPLGGDIIVAADGTPTPNSNRLSDVLANHKPGDTIKLVVYRGKVKKTIEVKLGRQPSSP